MVMGVDCEWVLDAQKRKQGKVPVIQFAITEPRTFVAVVSLDAAKPFPFTLKQLLEHSNVMKVGSHIFHDARNLYEDYGVLLKEAECCKLEKLCKANGWC